MSDVTTIDCHYLGERFAAAYLLRQGDRAAFVETNTQHALPYLLEALREQDLQPEQVDYVIVTHVHLDHAGGASALMDACPNAQLLAHPRAHPHLVDPSKLVHSAKQVYGDAQFREMYGEITPVEESRTRIMQDGEQLDWHGRRLTFLHTRGHANHHFCIHDAGSDGVFTGDAFGLVYPDLQAEGLLAIPSTSPTDFDAEAARASLERILGLGVTRAFLTHFGERRDLDAIAQQLDAQLQQYGAIVQDAERQAVADDQLDAWCAERVGAIFDDVLAQAGVADSLARDVLGTDADLNAQGVAFAVRKARFKAKKSS